MDYPNSIKHFHIREGEFLVHPLMFRYAVSPSNLEFSILPQKLIGIVMYYGVSPIENTFMTQKTLTNLMN